MKPRIPGCSYRLQLNKGFNFRDATALVDYLDALGATDVYASPFLTARPGSSHGYDVIDHGRLNPEIGTEGDLDALVAALRQRGMGLIMDVVPNHMCIASTDNGWWNDVLENGRSSPFAAFFDIDWHPPKTELHEKVLLPVLGEQYGRVLENQEISIEYGTGAFYARYWESRFPIGPRTILPLLEPIVADLRRSHPRRAPRRPRDREHRHRDDASADPLGHRTREGARANAREGDRQAAARFAGVGKRRRPRRAGTKPRRDQRRQAEPAQLRPAGGAAGRPGLPAQLLGRRRGRDQLPPLLRHQRPGRHPGRAAQRAGRRPRKGLPAAARGQGDRAAHRPRRRSDAIRAATSNLQRACAGANARWRGGAPAPPPAAAQPDDRLQTYVVVEKILSGDELLPRDWPVHGTTGYEFLNVINGLFVDSGGARAIERLYQRLREGRGDVRRSALPREAPDPSHRDVERAVRAGAAASTASPSSTAGRATSRRTAFTWRSPR